MSTKVQRSSIVVRIKGLRDLRVIEEPFEVEKKRNILQKRFVKNRKPSILSTSSNKVSSREQKPGLVKIIEKMLEIDLQSVKSAILYELSDKPEM